MTHHQEALLSRFISQVDKHNDTPSLIMMIAASADFLWACQAVIDPSVETDLGSTNTVERICRNHGCRLSDLKEKLGPAAKALGIIPALDSTSDYYRVLGVQEDASPQEIKRAYRSKAIKVHPDTSAGSTGSHRRFQDLNDAYRILRDPVSRRHYDAIRRQRPHWRESPARFLSIDGRASVYRWYLGGLIVVFIGLLFLMDIISFQEQLP